MLSLLLASSLYATAVPVNHTFGINYDNSTYTTVIPAADTRTIWNLIWSCSTIIFSCTWVAIHPNIPDPNDSTFKVKLKIFIVAVLAPEWIVMWAIRQFLKARMVRDVYNDSVAKSSGEIQVHSRGNVVILIHHKQKNGHLPMDFTCAWVASYCIRRDI